MYSVIVRPCCVANAQLQVCFVELRPHYYITFLPNSYARLAETIEKNVIIEPKPRTLNGKDATAQGIIITTSMSNTRNIIATR